MPLGLLHNGENHNKGYTIFFGVRMQSYVSTKIHISSLRITLATEMTNEDNH